MNSWFKSVAQRIYQNSWKNVKDLESRSFTGYCPQTDRRNRKNRERWYLRTDRRGAAESPRTTIRRKKTNGCSIFSQGLFGFRRGNSWVKEL